MVRVASVALLVAIIETPTWSQSIDPASKPLSPEAWRLTEQGAPRSSFTLPQNLDNPPPSGPDTRMFAGTEVSPNSIIGFGVFGLRGDKAVLPPATVYEVNTRQSRKPGLGFSFKF